MSFYLKYREISKLWQQNKSSKTTLSRRRKSHINDRKHKHLQNRRTIPGESVSTNDVLDLKTRPIRLLYSRYKSSDWIIAVHEHYYVQENVRVTLHSLKKMEPRPIVFKEWRDTRAFSNLKSTHCTFLILLIIILVTKKSMCIVSKVQRE